MTTKQLMKLEDRVYRLLQQLKEAAKSDLDLVESCGLLGTAWSELYGVERRRRDVEAVAAEKLLWEVFHPSRDGLQAQIRRTTHRLINRRCFETVSFRDGSAGSDWDFQEAMKQ